MNYCKTPIVTRNIILYRYINYCQLNFVTKCYVTTDFKTYSDFRDVKNVGKNVKKKGAS